MSETQKTRQWNNKCVIVSVCPQSKTGRPDGNVNQKQTEYERGTQMLVVLKTFVYFPEDFLFPVSYQSAEGILFGIYNISL